jgi:hypothetical protein
MGYAFQMKITVESTSKLVFLNGMQCRIWEGVTERGVKVHCNVPRIAVQEDQDLAQFEAELREQRKPSAEVDAIPLRLIL